MPNAITAIFGANSQPFRQEVDKASNYAELWQRKVNRNIGMSLDQWRFTGVAPDPLGVGKTAASAFNLNGILRETMVIFREIGRGNWARVPGSFSLILQYAGVLKYLLSGIGLSLVAAGFATYKLVQHWRSVVAEGANLNEIFGQVREKYVDMAKALENHHTQMLRAIDDAADFAEWQKRISESTESATSILDDQLSSLRKEADIRKEIARARGASQREIDAMEQESRAKEIAFTTFSLNAMKMQAASDMAVAEDAHNKFFDSTSEYDSKKAQEEDFKTTIRNAQEGLNQVDPKTRTQIAEFQARIDALRGKQAHGGKLSSREFTALHGAQGGMEAIKSKEFLDIEISGKKVRVSLDELDNIVHEAMAKQALLNKETEDLAKANRQYKDREITAKELAQKSNQAKIEYAKKLSEITDEYNTHAKLNPILEAAKGNRGGLGYSLTSQQRIGAYAATPPDWSVVLFNIKAIAHNTSHLNPGPSTRPPGAQKPRFGPVTHG